MKTKLLILFSFFTLAGFSQTPINSYYSEGLRIFSVLSSATPLDQNNAGANQIWDVSGIPLVGQVADQSDLPMESETNEFPGSSYRLQTFGEIDDVQTESIIYSTENAGVISITGLTSDGLKLNYITNNATVGTYPLNYGYSNTDAIEGTFNYTTYSGTFSGTLTTSVDAYGTVIQNQFANQQGSIAVTRLKTLQNINLFYPPFGNVGTITITSYSYYSDLGNTTNAPLFRSATTTMVVALLSINQTKTRMELLQSQNLSITEVSNENNTLKFFPNPASDFLTIQTNETIQSVTISDVNGRLVLQSNSSLNTINVSSLQNGLYFATIATNTGTVTKKIIKK